MRYKKKYFKNNTLLGDRTVIMFGLTTCTLTVISSDLQFSDPHWCANRSKVVQLPIRLFVLYKGIPFLGLFLFL